MRRAAFLVMLSLLEIATPVIAAEQKPFQLAMLSVGMPSDFAALAEDQRVVADVFFGGRAIGQFDLDASPSRIRFSHPDRLVAALPGVTDPALVAAALAADLDPNARFICSDAGTACERPSPDVAAVVYDAQHFRLDVYINPRLLVVQPLTTDRYLVAANRGASAVDTIGAAVAGGDGEHAQYDLRNRLVLGVGEARLISEASVSSGRGVDADTLAAQVDRPNLRYTGGLFYAPGADLVGRRRIVGVGIASQFDSRADRTLITGSPLIVFLGQRSRVDIYNGGKLMSSRSYEAGNQTLDTSSLPDGSYPIEIRIQEVGGATRTEQRFFTKSAVIPPAGHTVFFADAGVLAVDRAHRWVATAHVPLATVGAARRIGAHFAWDAAAMATNHKVLAEIGGTLLTKEVQARLALLGTTAGDYGAVIQANSTSSGRLGYNLDLRHIESHDGKALIPLDDDTVEPFTITGLATRTAALSSGSFTQMIGNLSYRVGRAQIGVAGYVRHDAGRPSTYAVGPTVHWPIIQRQRLQLAFDGSYAETQQGRSMAFGLRLQLFGQRSSFNAAIGGQSASPADGRHVTGLAELGGSIQRDHVAGGQLSAAGQVQRSDDGTIMQASADERSDLGYATGSLVHRIADGYATTQYSLNLQTSIAASAHALRIGAHDQNDSIIAVKLKGAARSTRFELLIDDSPQGVVHPGGHLTVSLTPYRRYIVRIRPIGGDLVTFDTRARTIDVYPGTVASLVWKVDPVVAMFGRLMAADGTAVANADVSTDGAVAATDERGYFQLQAARDAVLTVRNAAGQTCHATLDVHSSDKAYIPLGDVTCRP